MPSRRKYASKKVITQPIQAGRIAKHKSTATMTRAQAQAMSSSHIVLSQEYSSRWIRTTESSNSSSQYSHLRPVDGMSGWIE